MGKISNLSSYGFNEQPQFDGFINSLKEKADTTEIAEQVKKQESDIKNINDINTKQDEQILGLNVDIKQSGNAFTFTQGGKNLAVINQENGEGSSVIGGSFSNGKLTLNNSNNTSVEIDASSLAFKGDATSIPNLDAYATKQWVEDKKYLTQHQSLDDYAKTSEVSGELAKKSNVGHTHQISDITDLLTQFDGYATEEWVESKGYLTEHQDLSTYAKKADIPSLEGYATEQWVNSKNYLTSHQSLEDYATKEQLSTKANKEHTHLLKDITDYVAPNLSIYAKKTDIPSLNGYATEEWVTSKNYLTSHQSLEGYATEQWVNSKGFLTTHQSLSDYAKKTELANYYTKVESDDKYALSADIPSLNGYATEQWVTNQGYLTTHQSLTDYAKKTELANYYTKVESDDKYALKTSIPTLDGYATEEWVNSKGFLTTHQSLSDYAKKTELANYYTKAESDGKYALSADIPSLNGYATEQWVTNKGYLTTHQSLEDYATKEQLSTKADKEHTHLLKDITDYVAPNLSIYAKKTDIPSLNGYATEEWVNSKGFLTTHQSLADYAKKTDIPNMEGYATNEQLSTKQDKGDYALKSDIKPIPSVLSAFQNDVGYLTTHQDLTPYAKKTDIPSLEGYATEQWVNNKNYLTQHQSLEDYYTKSEVDNKFKNFSGVTSTDLTKYYTKVESDGKYATKEEIPSLNGYATEEWVNGKGYLTSHQDLTDYARKAEIKTVNGHSLIGSGDIQIEVGSSVDMSNYYTKTDSDGKYALKTDIPSLNGYATEQWVTEKNYLTQHQSLEDYYTKTDSDGKYALKTDIPSLNGYATEQWVTEKNYLTQHQSLEDYYTKTDSDGKYALKTEIQELPKFKTVNGQAITGSTGDITITPDLSNYYKKSDTSGATEIRDALAKKQDYNENYVTSDQLADYAKTSDVNRELGLKANTADIPTNKIELTFTLTDGSQITKKFYFEDI